MNMGSGDKDSIIQNSRCGINMMTHIQLSCLKMKWYILFCIIHIFLNFINIGAHRNLIIEFALPELTTKFGLLLGDFTYGDEYTGLLRLYNSDNGYGLCNSRKD